MRGLPNRQEKEKSALCFRDLLDAAMHTRRVFGVHALIAGSVRGVVMNDYEFIQTEQGREAPAWRSDALAIGA